MSQTQKPIANIYLEMFRNGSRNDLLVPKLWIHLLNVVDQTQELLIHERERTTAGRRPMLEKQLRALNSELLMPIAHRTLSAAFLSAPDRKSRRAQSV